MEIKVQQSIEMQSMPADDDDSERNLVNVESSWMVDVSTQNKGYRSDHGTTNGGKPRSIPIKVGDRARSAGVSDVSLEV